MMRDMLRSFAAGAAAVSLLLAGCGEQYPTYRYRMTVEVDTPQGLRSGSSVIEVRTDQGPRFPGPEAGGVKSRIRGEAVAVDLPRGTLFALLQSPNGRGAESYAWALLPRPPTRGDDAEGRRANYEALGSVQGQAELQPENYPMLVTFRDLADPTSVEAANPADFASVFGPGYALRRIMVRVTDEPVTSTISEQLRWLGSSPEPRLDRSYRGSTSPSLDQELAHGDFLRGGR